LICVQMLATVLVLTPSAAICARLRPSLKSRRISKSRSVVDSTDRRQPGRHGKFLRDLTLDVPAALNDAVERDLQSSGLAFLLT